MIVNKLNDKKICELSEFWRKIIKEMFDIANDNEIVNARVIGKSCKTDIEIYCMDKKINISVKTGDHNSFHQENIFQLLDFLQKSGVSQRTLNIIKFYHFGDGTIDGTGSKRMDAAEIKLKYAKLIREANEEINKRSYEYTLPHEIPNVVKEKEPEKAPVFITSQNTKEDEIVIEEKPKEVKIITPEITDIK